MIVQFDLGNSAVKWRLMNAGQRVEGGFFRHAEAWPAELVNSLGAVTELQVASVADDAATSAFLDRFPGDKPGKVVIAESQPEQLGLKNAYRNPAQMGVDRWLAMLGAWVRLRAPVIVVDAGSAITIDLVGARGRHQGGYIMPGRRLMLEGLQQGTSRVLFTATDDPLVAPGSDTQSCVSRGLSRLCRGLVLEVHGLAREYGIEEIWLTGGDARYLQEAGLTAHWSPDLVLDGLAVYATAPEQSVTGARR